MIKGSDKVDYRYLNLITKKFTASQEILIDELKYVHGAKVLSVRNDYGQVLFAGGHSDISQCHAVIICRRLSGEYKKILP